jgi:predicted amidohydrolase
MVVTVGAPVAPADASTNALPAIGAITYLPDGSHTVYRKVHLHPGEERYASAGAAGSSLLPLGLERVAQAICADITHATHPAHAAQVGATVYAAGVLESEAGYLVDAAAMQQYAQRHAMGVLMANHGGPSGGYVSAGKSAFWAPGGQLVVAAPGAGPWLVIATRTLDPNSTPWSPRLVPMA